MSRAMTRSKPIQVWFATVLLVTFAGVAVGASVSVGTAVMLFALSLVVLGIVLFRVPGVTSRTAADVLYSTDRRG